MNEHKLKTWPKYFYAIEKNAKTFDLRKNDRNFKVGDILVLREWNHRYTGREIKVIITYIMGKENPFFNLKEFVIMSIKKVEGEK